MAVQVAQYGADWPAFLAAAREAEAMGVDALFNWDHFFGPGANSTDPNFECWTMLAAWAASTSQITLGPLVSCIGYRNPDLVADMARTVDHVAGGRLILGVGAGFKERDYLEYGYEFGSVASRITDLEHGLARIRNRLLRLQPPPAGPLPILIAGSGERRMLRLVAQHADTWHTFAEGEAFAHKSRVLDRYCREIGRPPDEIERSVLVAGDPASVGQPLRDLGATLFVVSATGRPEIDFAPVAEWLRWRDLQNA
ncbi:LLM class F420-dependent oxidoreductase [Actinospica sp.]|uniref:LLM class F420-dependent oxidoreductase n=1 Tax=Actinospica sp. TaxID=1872142 RepID=UPI002BF6B2F7|nr:LLM class F420-dependent oxidoreductase [Actinospica sp.]HWG25534.1 LLM class F420-dependent oxidoreductase [Actinospica sp.]